MEPVELTENNFQISNTNGHAKSNDHGWQTVTYPKRHRKQKQADPAANQNPAKLIPNGTLANGTNVFRSLEQQSEDRRRRILEAQKAAEAAEANGAAPTRSKHRSDNYDEEDDGSDAEIAAGKENDKAGEAKKVKPKKPKKPKVTVAEAAAKIDVADLSAFLVEISESYATQQDIQLMRVADYLGRAFSGVTAGQFPWLKLFKEATVAKMADIPLSHITDPVYKTIVDWINQRSLDALSIFVLWALDCILADLTSQQGGAKGSKKGVQHTSSKSQVAIFVALAMVLRRKPDSLTNVLPTLRENSKYQGQDKLPVIVWMMTQALQGDLSVGLYSWAHNLLPTVTAKNCNPQSRDLILQLVERIMSNPKARTILVNGAVRKGERLIPPPSFEMLLRVTFPASSARVKATERFEAVYPTLKEVALAGSPGSKAMKQTSQQIFSFAFKAAGESIPELSKEAAGIAVWCLTQNADCCKQWDKVYQDNFEASVAVLKKLLEEWKEVSAKLSPAHPLKETIKNFRHKNEKAIAGEADSAHQATYKDADKHCKLILSRLSRGNSCLKGVAVLAVALAAGAALFSPNIAESLNCKHMADSFDLKHIAETFDLKHIAETFDWNKLSEAFRQ